MSKKLPAKDNPLFKGEETLEFDGIDAQLLSDSEKADRFMTIYLRVAHPLTLNRNYFSTIDQSRTPARVFHLFKAGYKKFVCETGWTEKKYAATITDILETGKVPSFPNIEQKGKLFDSGELLSQRRTFRTKGKRL